MLTTLVTLCVATVPEVSTTANETARTFSLTGGVVSTWGWAPGQPFSLSLGVRGRWGRFSLGLEAQPLMPGVETVTAGEVRRATFGYLPERPIATADTTIVSITRGVGVVGQIPVCLEWGKGWSTCVLVAGGAVQLDRQAWHPLLSVGPRVGGEFPHEAPVRFRASAQILGGILRPTTDTWHASPIQLGLSAGLVADL